MDKAIGLHQVAVVEGLPWGNFNHSEPRDLNSRKLFEAIRYRVKGTTPPREKRMMAKWKVYVYFLPNRAALVLTHRNKSRVATQVALLSSLREDLFSVRL